MKLIALDKAFLKVTFLLSSPFFLHNFVLALIYLLLFFQSPPLQWMLWTRIFQTLHVLDLIILCCEGQSYYYRIFNSLPAITDYMPVAFFSCDKQKCLQTLWNVPRERAKSNPVEKQFFRFSFQIAQVVTIFFATFYWSIIDTHYLSFGCVT